MSRINHLLALALVSGIVTVAGCKGTDDAASTSSESAASSAAAETAPAADAAPADDCKLEIVNWNPREITPGQAFNVQKDGESAYWVKVSPESRGFAANVGGQPVALTYGTGLVTFLHQGPVAAAESQDTIRVDFTCNGAPAGNIDIQVKR